MKPKPEHGGDAIIKRDYLCVVFKRVNSANLSMRGVRLKHINNLAWLNGLSG